MKRIRVDLGELSYPIHIGSGNLDKVGEMLMLLGSAGRIVIITNTSLDKLYGRPFTEALTDAGAHVLKIAIADGEEYKTLRTADAIFSQMLKAGCDRQSMVLAFGGGVVGDVAGFVAATFMRGVHYAQVPTSLLAQVDASVGGKVAVNHALGKNMIGAFYQPRLVWVDLDLLKTLPRRELRCGMAEVVKYGIIFDADFFESIQDDWDEMLALDPDALESTVARCCEIKAEVVAEDERESGLRAILNFGHTVGHAIETITDYGRFKHGEAIALGMLAESKMAQLTGTLSDSDFESIASALARFEMPKGYGRLDVGKIMAAMLSDKKARSGRLRLVVPERVGSVILTDEVPDETVRAGIEHALQTDFPVLRG